MVWESFPLLNAFGSSGPLSTPYYCVVKLGSNSGSPKRGCEIFSKETYPVGIGASEEVLAMVDNSRHIKKVARNVGK